MWFHDNYVRAAVAAAPHLQAHVSLVALDFVVYMKPGEASDVLPPVGVVVNIGDDGAGKWAHVVFPGGTAVVAPASQFVPLTGLEAVGKRNQELLDTLTTYMSKWAGTAEQRVVRWDDQKGQWT